MLLLWLPALPLLPLPCCPSLATLRTPATLPWCGQSPCPPRTLTPTSRGARLACEWQRLVSVASPWSPLDLRPHVTCAYVRTLSPWHCVFTCLCSHPAAVVLRAHAACMCSHPAVVALRVHAARMCSHPAVVALRVDAARMCSHSAVVALRVHAARMCSHPAVVALRVDAACMCGLCR